MFTLKIHPPHSGLPSIDPNSISLIAYCKILKIPCLVEPVFGLKLLSSSIPFIYYEDKIIKSLDLEAAISFFNQHNYNLDSALKDEERSDCEAFKVLINDNLLPAVNHTFWINSQNFIETTRPIWFSFIFCPFSLYLPVKERNKREKSLNNLEEKEILDNGKQCLNTLSRKLGDHTFLLGDQPSSLDCQLFGMLLPLLKLTHPSKQLSFHLNNCQNLVIYCNRILDRFFPENSEKLKKLEKEKEEKEKKIAKEAMSVGDFPNKRRDIAIGITIALGSMLAYAVFFKKIIKFDFIEAA